MTRLNVKEFIDKITLKSQEKKQPAPGFSERKHSNLSELYQDFTQTYTRKGECEISGTGTDTDPLIIHFPFTQDLKISLTEYRTEIDAEFTRLQAHLRNALQKMRQQNTTVPQDVTVIKKYVRIPQASPTQMTVSEATILNVE